MMMKMDRVFDEHILDGLATSTSTKYKLDAGFRNPAALHGRKTVHARHYYKIMGMMRVEMLHVLHFDVFMPMLEHG